MKTLVVYFSRTGHGARVAREIARQCQADLDAIRELSQSGGWGATWSSCWRTLARQETPIHRPARNPARYELVVIGAPVSKLGLAPPVRSYLRQFAERFKQVAFFSAEGGSDDMRLFDELGRLCGKQPVATFAVQRKNLPLPAHSEGLSGFLDSIHLR
jgi:hypothetical protein